MKKIYSIIAAIICAILGICGMDFYIRKQLDKNLDKAFYYNNDVRNSCDYILDKLITDKSIVVFGSSELSAADDLAYPPSLFNAGYSDFNMVLIGRGYTQSISHAINLGALQDNIKNNKVVLILSPQWFTEEHTSSAVFCSRFQELMFVEFLQNRNISKNTKIAVTNRMNELLVEDPVTLERVKKYQDIYLYHSLNPITYGEMAVYNLFEESKQRFELNRELKKIKSSGDPDNFVKAEQIDFRALLEEAECLGEKSCTNNEYGVYNDYFDTYIRDKYDSYKDANSNSSYVTSREYDDFSLFLDICQETGIEPLIVSVPVNGRWYDYTGFPAEDRQIYYQKIRTACEEYGVEIADFSGKEYELYFLKDIMHMGWKGWVYLDEAVYEFYKK